MSAVNLESSCRWFLAGRLPLAGSLFVGGRVFGAWVLGTGFCSPGAWDVVAVDSLLSPHARLHAIVDARIARTIMKAASCLK